MKLIINPKGGFSGDMFISGLISLGVDFEKMKDVLEYAGNLLGKAEIRGEKTDDDSQRVKIFLKSDRDYLKGEEAKKLIEKVFEKFNIEEKYRDFGRRILKNLLEAEKKAHSENVFHSDHYTLHPIGKVSSNKKYKDKDAYVIEVFNKYALGLKEIMRFSHIFVLTYLDQSFGYSLNVTPPWEKKGIKVGVFASRSPNRPNPIGLNKVELYGVEDNLLYTQPFDIFDNTPVIDIKPVVKDIDNYEDANKGWIESDEHLEFHKKGIPHRHDNEDSYLHEAQDIILDISGAVFGMQELGLDFDAILIHELSVGGGVVKFSHGILDVPAPATKNIIDKFNIPYKKGPIEKELCTPTGASILAALNLKIDKNYEINNIKSIGVSRGGMDYPIPPLKLYIAD